MAMEDMDPSLIQDFLTESNELIEQLDADLVKLEESGDEAQSKDLLNSVFRALHTIKGAASFLSLTTLTTFAHAAEDALNRLRKGGVTITPEIMDAMLRSVDVLRDMLGEMAQGQPITEGPQDLIAQLHAITEQGNDASPTDSPAEDAQPPATAGSDSPGGTNESVLDLPPQKADLVDFMAADLSDAAKKIGDLLDQIKDITTRSDAAHELAELAATTRQTADFFDLKALTCLVDLLAKVSPAIPQAPQDGFPDLLIRLDAIRYLIQEQAEALGRSIAINWPLDTFQQRLETLADGQPLPDGLAGQHDGSVTKLLEIDAVIEPG